MIDRRQRVLIVGSGRRVQNNFLPALRCLADLFEIRGIHSRTVSHLLPVAQSWGVEPVVDLEESRLSEIDVVAISVPTSQNAPVLRKLLPQAHRLHIVIDTPIAWNAEERAAAEPLLARFAQVTVAEDYMNFPQFALIREAARRGLIGQIRYLTLFNIGFLYHGLALIRSFCGFEPVLRTSRHAFGSFGILVEYRFRDAFTATVVGPYRRHTTGGLMLEGSEGIITEFPADAALSNKPIHTLAPVHEGGLLNGYRIAGEGCDLAVDLPDLRSMRGMDFADKFDLNLVRGCGLIEVFRSVAGAHNINQDYGYRHALYDAFVSQRAERGESPLDPFNTFSEVADSLGALSWVANQRTFLKGRPEMASSLPPNEVVEVRTNEIVAAEHAEAHGSHTQLFSARLNGKPLPRSSWYIYTPAWDRR